MSTPQQQALSAGKQTSADEQTLTEELIRLTAILASERNLEIGLGAIIAAAARLTNAEGARIFVVDRSVRRMQCIVSQRAKPGPAPGEIQHVQVYRDGDRYNLTDVNVLAAISGRLVHIADVYNAAGYDLAHIVNEDAHYGYKTWSLTVAPLWGIDGTTLGVLQLINIRREAGALVGDTLDENTSRLIRTFASYAAVAIAIGRLFDENSRLVRQLDRKTAELELENSLLKTASGDTPDAPGIIAGSSTMRSVLDFCRRAAGSSRVTVLLLGETGTGKDVFANCIHRWSDRAAKPFIVQNCAAVPETLLESELFGFAKGAFSGAVTDKKGLFQEADGGTLFLDEIGDMPLGLQAKILRVLEDGTVRRLGETSSRKVDVRIIAATNVDMPKKIAEGSFREDLFYRLSVFPITIPPLRDRTSDIPRLIDHFLLQAARLNGRTPPAFTGQALDALSGWHFPGNVRELRNVVERAMLLVDADERIDLRHLPAEITAQRQSIASVLPKVDEAGDLRSAVRCYEARVIETKLRELGWNQSRAARHLKISRRSLIEKLERYSIKPPRSI